MRKIILTLLVVALSFTACNRSTPAKKDGEKVIASESGCFFLNSCAVETDTGYYFLGDLSDHFMYIDKETGEISVLCSKINCTHTVEKVPETCDSYVGRAMFQSLYYHDGYIYYIKFDDFECTLCRISEDGSEHESLYFLGTAPDWANNYYNYVVTDDYVYYSEGIPRLYLKNKVYVKRIDRKDGKTEVLYEDEGENLHLNDLSLYGENVIFLKGVSLNEDLYMMDTKKGEPELIAEKVSSYTMKEDGTLAYWKRMEGAYEYNFETGKHVKIFEADEETYSCLIAYANGAYYIDNMFNNNYNPDSRDFLGILADGKVIFKMYDDESDFFYAPYFVGEGMIIVEGFKEDFVDYLGYFLTDGKTITVPE